MTEGEERKLLKQLLDALEDTAPKRWAWQAFAINAASFFTLTVIALWLYLNPQLVDAFRVISLLGALFAGAMIGALSTWKMLCKNGDVVRRYISPDKVRARLAELEP